MDAAGDLFIADTANCRVRVLPAATAHALRAGGDRRAPLHRGGHRRLRQRPGRAGPSRRPSCGTRWPWPSTARATSWWPTAATSRCCWRPPGRDLLRHAPSAPATSASSWAGTGSYGPYLADGLARQRADGRAQRPPRPGRRPDGRALRDRRLHARHPGRPRRRPGRCSAGHEGGRPLHGGRRPPRVDAARASTTAHAGCVTRMGTPVGRRGVAVGGAVLRRRRPRHGAGDRDGSRVAVSRFGRRTFLASSAGVAAARRPRARRRCTAARRSGAAARAARAARRAAARAGPAAGRRAHGQRPDRPGGDRPRRLLVRLDAAGAGRAPWPDGLPRRGAAHRPGPDAGSSGTAAPCPRPGRPSSPTAGRRWPPTRPTSGRSRRGARRTLGAGRRPRPASPRRCGTATGRPSGCARPATRRSPTA